MLESPHAALFRGVLGDLVEVEAECARAVEVALGESLQALIAHSDNGLLKGIAHLRERSGRVGILSLEAPPRTLGPLLDPDPMPGLRGPLLDYVRPEASIAPLIAGLLHKHLSSGRPANRIGPDASLSRAPTCAVSRPMATPSISLASHRAARAKPRIRASSAAGGKSAPCARSSPTKTLATQPSSPDSTHSQSNSTRSRNA